jgi:hypothetical protein
VTFTVSVGQELTHANIPLDTVHNRNKSAQIHGLLGLQTFIITLYLPRVFMNAIVYVSLAFVIEFRCDI